MNVISKKNDFSHINKIKGLQTQGSFKGKIILAQDY
jgi:hypothetical protein